MDKEAFNKANSTIHPVERQWHYPLMVRFGFKPITKEATGFVRSYEYVNNIDRKIVLNTGFNFDYWKDEMSNMGGYWSDLENYLGSIYLDDLKIFQQSFEQKG